MLEMPKAQGQSLNIRLILAFSISAFAISTFAFRREHPQPKFNLMPAAFQTTTGPLHVFRATYLLLLRNVIEKLNPPNECTRT
jgi:hypothetical protein